EERNYRAVVSTSLPPRPRRKTPKSDDPDSIWGVRSPRQQRKLVTSRRVRFATVIFHIRRRLAGSRVASHARGRWLRAGCTRGLEALERFATDECDNSRCALDRSGNTSNRRFVDSNRGNFHSID